MQKYYQNERRFNGVYSRDNLPKKVKGGTYVENFDEHTDVGTHWITLYLEDNIATYFDSFGVILKMSEATNIYLNLKLVFAKFF